MANDPETTWTHLDDDGRPAMVDISDKDVTVRTAVARGVVRLPEAALEGLAGDELYTKKGPVFQTAILAGIGGAKETSRYAR